MVDFLITPASGTAAISDSSGVSTTPGANKLWASGTNLYWSTTQIDGGGGGTIGGTTSANKIVWSTATDTLADFTTALTTGSSLFIGSDPTSSITSGEYSNAVGVAAMANVEGGGRNDAFGYAALNALTAGWYNVAVGMEVLKNVTGADYNTYVGYNAGTTRVAGDRSVGIGFLAGQRPTGNDNTFVGAYAGSGSTTPTTAYSNVAIGRDAMLNISSGYQNVAVGNYAGKVLTTGYDNVLVGYEAGLDLTTGKENVLVGREVAANMTTGNYNTVVGHKAYMQNAGGERNTAIGYNAMKNYTEAGSTYNVSVGMYSMYNIQTGSANIAIGYEAMYGVTGDDNEYNVAVGYQALKAIDAGDNNVAIGSVAGTALTTPTYTTLVGADAGKSITTGTPNTFVGGRAGAFLTIGERNTGLGQEAMKNSTEASYNTAVGHQALYTNVDGDNNTAIGYNALYTLEPSNNAGSNTAVGMGAGRMTTTGTGNVFMGYEAARNSTEVADLVVIGKLAGRENIGNYNVIMGSEAAQAATSMDNSVIIGRQAAGAAAATGDYNVLMGYKAGYDLTTGYDNVGVGREVLENITTGIGNTALGRTALYSLTTGTYNVAVGYTAGYSLTIGTGNVMLGNQAGYDLTDGHQNVLIGEEAGENLVGGGYNVAIGSDALKTSTAASYAIAIGKNALSSGLVTASLIIGIGYNALGSATDADETVAIGGYSGDAITTANYNTFVGYNSASQLTTSPNNTAVGHGAMLGHATQDTTSTSNVAIGMGAMYLVSGANYNVAVGDGALSGATAMQGDNNVAVGRQSLHNVTSANDSVAIGYQAGLSTSTGAGNVSVGYAAGRGLTDGQNNVFVGNAAGYYETGDFNTFLGHRAGEGGSGEPDTLRSVFIGYLSGYRQSGASYNVAVGTYSAAGVDFSGGSNVMMGYAAGQVATTANANVFLGYYAGSSGTTADHSVFIGNQAGQEITTGDNNIHIGSSAGRYITTGAHNVSLGFQSMFTNVDGSRNVAIGSYSLYNFEPGTAGYGKNVAIGYTAGQSVTTGTGNVFIGYDAGNNTGHDTESNKLVIANSNTTTPLIDGDFSSPALTVNAGLTAHGLRPVTDNTYTIGTAALRYTEAHIDDGFIAINADGATTNHAGAGRFWVSGTTPYFNASVIQLGTGTPATIADGRWADGTSSAAGLAMADYGAVSNALSTTTAGYLTWNNDTSTLQVRKLAIGGASFSLGGQEVTDIKISSDSASTSNSDLVTAGYVDAHAGGGSPGGSDTQIQFNNGGAFGGVSGFTTTDDGSDVTITSATASKPVLMLKNTNADANAGELQFYKKTTSEADNDLAGNISFYFDNDGSVDGVEKVRAAQIYATSVDVTEDSEDGAIFGKHVYNGTEYQNIHLGGHYNASVTSVWVGQEGTSGFLGFANNTAANNYLLFGTRHTTGSSNQYQVGGFTMGNAAYDGNQQLTIRAQDDIGIYAGQSGSTANSTISFYTNNAVTSDANAAMRIDKDGNVGIGTTSPSKKLHIVDTATQLRLDNDGTNITDFFVDSGGDLQIAPYGDAIEINSSNSSDLKIDMTNSSRNWRFHSDNSPDTFNIVNVTAGTTAMTFDSSNNVSFVGTVHASGASFQKDLGESLYIRAIHGGFDQNAILGAAPNIQYVAPAGPSAAGTSPIPTELPLAEAGMEGLEITVMQTWAADPTAALQVQVSTGSPDVIYEGGSNSASANVSVAAYRGANKTFIIAAESVWVVKG